MRITEEMMTEDEKRWHARDVVTELGYCGNYMRDRKDMKNIDIRFYAYIMRKAYAMLKEAVEPKTIPEELKQKMWNALYAEEDKFEEKYVGTKEHSSWFLIYRPWLQEGFNLAIKAIADWEGQ